MTTTAKTKHLVLANAAIDLGFFQVKIASGRGTSKNGSEILTDILPSHAPRVASEKKGLMALSKDNDSGVVIDVDGVGFFVGESSMDMFDAKGSTRGSNDGYCLTPAYKALFLGALWHIAKRHGVEGSLTIKHLVLGLPLTSIVDHKESVRGMAMNTHAIPNPFSPNQTIRVSVEEALVVAQPQGGVVAYTHGEGRNKVKPNHNILVLDMGGGTFDWFHCNGKFQPKYNLCGALPTGTINCSEEILKIIKPTLVNSPLAMDRVDMALRLGSSSFDLAGVSYEVSEFTNLINTLIGGAIEQMKTKVGALDVLDHIILTGGGASLLERVCANSLTDSVKVIRVDPDPVYSNVKGFFIISEMMTNVMAKAA